MPKKKRPSTSGTAWSESDYAAQGYTAVKVRLQRDVMAEFKAIMARWGTDRTATIVHLIRNPPKRGPKPEKEE